jgi:hypothetical protein
VNIRSAAVELFDSDRQTDRQIEERLDTQKNMRKLTASFQQFLNADATMTAKGINKYEYEQKF